MKNTCFQQGTQFQCSKVALLSVWPLPFQQHHQMARSLTKAVASLLGWQRLNVPTLNFMCVPQRHACADESFCAEIVNGKPRLKRGHQYYFQIQGQLGITGASWCVFVICSNKGMSIERVTFDPKFWDVLNKGPKNSYFEHFIAKVLQISVTIRRVNYPNLILA